MRILEDEYILVDIQDSKGEFVGKVREEYEKELQNIITKCTTLNIFKSEQAKEIIKYVKEKYNDDFINSIKIIAKIKIIL